MGHFVETRWPANMKYVVVVALALAAYAAAEPEASADPGYNYYGYRYPHYRYGYGHLNGYGYYGHPNGLGYRGYGHYGKRSASRHPQPKSVPPTSTTIWAGSSAISLTAD